MMSTQNRRETSAQEGPTESTQPDCCVQSKLEKNKSSFLRVLLQMTRLGHFFFNATGESLIIALQYTGETGSEVPGLENTAFRICRVMPYLHGFRRIVYEYQPLVDAVMNVVGQEEGDGNHESRPEDERHRCSSLIELLERESQSEVFLEGISYSLFKVAEQGRVEAAEVLLQYKANLNFEDPVSFYSPLHIAVLRNRPNMVNLLVEHNADIEKRDRIHESSPLDLASEDSDRLPCLLALLELGANVNARDKRGKTPLLHALASSDGLTVNNTENIQILLQRGADVNAAAEDGETVASSLVFLVKEALDGSAEEAAEMGKFCLKTTQLLLAHGMDPSCDANDSGSSLTQTSLEHFDLLFPLAVLIIQSGASLFSADSDSCWQAPTIIFQRLQSALRHCSDPNYASELLEQAELLLDLAKVNYPRVSPHPILGVLTFGQDPHPCAPALQDLYSQVVMQDMCPAALKCICRAFIRSHLQPWPLEERINALPLPDRLKGFLLPERTYKPKPGWDCFKPQQSHL